MGVGLIAFIFLLLSYLFIKSKITLSVWSIKVFRNPSFLSKQPQEHSLDRPSLQALDVTDVRAEFVADPFIIKHETQYYMFFEVFDKAVAKGVIGLADSRDGEKWTYDKIVLREGYHLSYPFVFRYLDEYYMIPETIEANKVLLYKAKSFPYNWVIANELVEGKYVDPTVFQYDNKWWMFAGTEGKLHLFFSDQLYGTWKEHPKSPLLSENYNVTRPGGRVLVEKDAIYRYTQNGQPYYGSAVTVFKIHKLSEVEYEEEKLDQILIGSNKDVDWRKDGMHSIDQLQIGESEWLIAVDGHHFKKRNRVIAKVDYILSRFLYYKRV